MRRLLKIFGSIVAVLLLAAATLPWWLGGLLSVAKKSFDLEYGKYERIGYGRFALSDVRYHRGTVVVTAGRIEADTPVLYGWRHLRKISSRVSVNDWRVEVKSNGETPSDPDDGWMSLRGLLLRIADGLDDWLPEAHVKTGEVVFPGGRIGLEAGDWRHRVLRVEGLVWRNLSVRGQAEFVSPAHLIRLQLADAKNSLQAELESLDDRVEGKLRWNELPLAVNSKFAGRGWLPFQARAAAENWTVDPQRLQLGTAYATVQGGGQIEWRKESFTLDLSVKAESSAGNKIPPVELVAHGRGDLDTLTIDVLHAAIPGFKADLSQPVRLSREGQLLSGPSRFSVEADLALQTWLPASGKLKGEAQIETGHELKPRVSVQLSAEGLKVESWSVPHAQVTGVLDWPQLNVSEASTSFGTDEEVKVSGGYNFETKELSASQIEARLKRATLSKWWAEAPVFSQVNLKATLQGPLARISHAGRAQISGLNVPPLRPVDVAADWTGAADTFENFKTVVSTPEASIAFNGSGDFHGVKIDALRIQKNATTWLSLENAVRIDWKPALQCEPIALSGDAGSIDFALRAGMAGEAMLKVKDFSTAWLHDWLLWRGPDWRVPLIDLAGTWNRGPMDFSLDAAVDIDVVEQRPVELRLKAKGGAEGLKIETLHVFEGQQEAMSASGSLPVVFTPASPSPWAFDASAPLNFTATTQPDATFWTYLAETTGLVIEHPQTNLELSGNWQSPHGKILVQIPRLAVDEARFKRKLPVVENIVGQIDLDRGQIALHQLTATIAGQKFQAEGQLPLPKNGLAALQTQSWQALVEKATARVQIPRAELAALAPYASDFLAPKGQLDLDVSLAEGKADGFLRVENAGTRPIGPLGVLQDIKADLKFVDRRLDVQSVQMKMGSQLVEIKGSAEWAENNFPRFDLTLKGEHLPFIRQVGLLLRGDLDLKLTSTDNGVGRITGKVKLRESLFSIDVRDLVPKGGGGNAARPPFFSVENPPFNAWQLDVDLSGDHFLRLRTPVFNGLASMHFQLANTLGEPRATGQAVIDRGQVLLPFATFAIQQGSVQLTESNPYEPRLFVTGTSRRYGYDLRMEMTGTASAPVLKFSSSPPLNSEQVLLLVMAGETPNSEVSYSGNQRAVRFGAFLGKSLFSSVSTDSNGVDRLTINAGEKVSRQGRETYEVEYWLGQRWSLVGEYDEFDDYNAGLKWRALIDKPRKSDAK